MIPFSGNWGLLSFSSSNKIPPCVLERGKKLIGSTLGRPANSYSSILKPDGKFRCNSQPDEFVSTAITAVSGGNEGGVDVYSLVSQDAIEKKTTIIKHSEKRVTFISKVFLFKSKGLVTNKQ